MPTVIRAADHQQSASGVAFNFDDLAAEAKGYLDKIRAEAAAIIAKAGQESEGIRKRAEMEGRQAAMAATEEIIRKQLASALAALRQAALEIGQARQAWLSHWEASGVHVAASIARRVIRRELKHQPEITLGLVREALELAAGSSEVRLCLHPTDQQALGRQVQLLVEELSGLGAVEVRSDPAITCGGCRVETRFGVIDQQFEAQLARIEEELNQ
ncbi:MAG: FliH/SctL family protein [Thermoguttaceae bacterium]|jgi:flagellar assembly protein FliH